MSNLILIEILLSAMGLAKPIPLDDLGMRGIPAIACGEKYLGLQLEVDKDWAVFSLDPLPFSLS